jgi:hypothetical protein
MKMFRLHLITFIAHVLRIPIRIADDFWIVSEDRLHESKASLSQSSGHSRRPFLNL